jgi:hypothetical protein
MGKRKKSRSPRRKAVFDEKKLKLAGEPTKDDFDMHGFANIVVFDTEMVSYPGAKPLDVASRTNPNGAWHMREMTLLIMKSRTDIRHEHWHFYNGRIPYDRSRTTYPHSTYLRERLGLLENPTKDTYIRKRIPADRIRDSRDWEEVLQDGLNALLKEGKTLVLTKGGPELSWLKRLKYDGVLVNGDNLWMADLEWLGFPTAKDLRGAYKIVSLERECDAHTRTNSTHCSSEECGLFMQVIRLNTTQVITMALREIAQGREKDIYQAEDFSDNSDEWTMMMMTTSSSWEQKLK